MTAYSSKEEHKKDFKEENRGPNHKTFWELIQMVSFGRRLTGVLGSMRVFTFQRHNTYCISNQDLALGNSKTSGYRHGDSDLENRRTA